MKDTSIDIDDVFSKGGKALVQFLDYCVRSIQLDPLFIFLIMEYRRSPTAVKAVALYDIFCAPNAAGRISALPACDLRLKEMIRPLQANRTQAQPASLDGLDPAVPPLLPPKYLFDSVVRDLEKNSQSLSEIRRCYNPELSSIENLPGGTLNARQRHFVDNIWQPVIRPHLIAAGFWRIATIA